MMQIEHISKKICRKNILNNIDFVIHPGEIIGLLGSNGAGKTTLLKIIAGIFQQTNGNLYLFGKNINKLSFFERIQKKVCYLSQEIVLYEYATVIELFKSIENMSTRKAPKSDSFDYFFKSDKMNQKINSLSYGEKRRLEISLHLLRESELFLFDEVLLGLDPKNIKAVLQLIKDLSILGKMIVISGHDYHYILNVCSKILCLDQGETIYWGNPEFFNNDHTVKLRYLGYENDFFL